MNSELYQHFVDFCQLKLAIDGSDSYITGAISLARESEDPYWYAGCFSTFYAPPSQEVFTRRWSRKAIIKEPDKVLEWCEQHWQGLPLSRVRRVNRMGPHKLVRTLSGYAAWLDSGGMDSLNKSDSFDSAFKTLMKGVPNHGRYTGLKLYEALRRLGAPLPTVTDIRPNGASVPRRTLGAIFDHNTHDNSAVGRTEADSLSDILKQAVPTTWFNVEMLLCNFMKTIKGGYYPGHALDRELEHIAKVQKEFGQEAGASTLRTRQTLYRAECLGENNNWSGTRRELLSTFVDHGYIWSDLRFKYDDTADLGSPVKRRSPKRKALIGKGEERI